MSTDNTPQEPDARQRLLSTFAGHAPSTHPSRWESMWAKNDLPWDKGFPSPSLVDLLDSHRRDSSHNNDRLIDLPSRQQANTRQEQDAQQAQPRRKRALVPGCGKGYDVLLLAAHGYDAYGLESSATALQAAEEVKRARFDSDPEYRVRNEAVGRGEVRFLYGDFFADEWFAGVRGGGVGEEGFDLVYDYTFLCALPPSIRPQWAQRMSFLVSRSAGRLVCLEFPTYKAPSAGGPPWAVRPAFYVAYLSNPGEQISYGEDGVVDGLEDEERPERSSDGLVRMAHWRPERTHEAGKDTDWMSVWRH